MQQISEEHKQLEITGDILTNIFRNQNSYTIKLTGFEKIAFTYVDAIKQINIRYGLIYTKIGSPSDGLTKPKNKKFYVDF